jgi:hypothetical protein
MRSRLSVLLFTSFVVAACGGGGSSNDGTGADAASDTPPPVDAPQGLTGLGQKCGTGLPQCPTEAPGCITAQGASVGICTNLCVMNGTAKGDANGGFTMIMPDPTAAAQVMKCTSIYHGTVGSGACNTIIAGGTFMWMPPDNPPKNGTSYTNLNMACGIKCGAGNTCDAGLTCNAQTQTCAP